MPRTKTATKTTRAPAGKSERRSPRKAAVKAGVKPAVKSAVKSSVKAGAKTGAKAGAKIAVKTQAKNGSKTGAKKSTETSVKDVPMCQWPIERIWPAYKKAATEEMRNVLMENYLHLVKYNAERIHAKLPDEVDVEDLMSAGVFGLIDAIDAFDLTRGVKFETYCAPRIRGAILDELRAMDWVPRLVRSRSSQVDAARKSLEKESGQKPSEEEIASRMKLPRQEYEKIRKDAGAVSVHSLSHKRYETDSSKDVREIDVLEDSRQVNPLSAVQRRDLKAMITKRLSRAERLIVVLYYYEQMTMKEIGVTLDLSESRVSQMHSSILARLKAQLQHRSKELQEGVGEK